MAALPSLPRFAAQMAEKMSRRFTLSCDPAGSGDYAFMMLYDTKRNQVAWTGKAGAFKEIPLPWWLRLRLLLGQVTIVFER